MDSDILLFKVLNLTPYYEGKISAEEPYSKLNRNGTSLNIGQCTDRLIRKFSLCFPTSKSFDKIRRIKHLPHYLHQLDHHKNLKCLSIHNKLMLYKFFIRSTMTYESEGLGSVCETQLQNLQIAHNTILREIVNATMIVRNNVIRKDLKIRPISQPIKKLALNFHRNRVLITNDMFR